MKHCEFVLGTVQLGMVYGAANRHGLPSEEEAQAILSVAYTSGVRTFDTARAYGLSEERVGRFLRRTDGTAGVRIITKLAPLSGLDPQAPARGVAARALASIEQSLSALGLRELSTLLLHRWAHRRSHGGAIWETLLEARAQGKIGVLGASVSNPAEALECLSDPEVRHIQLPVNCLDWRWEAAGVPQACAQRPEVILHGRSVLLQGLLAAGPEDWPEIPGVNPERYLTILDELSRRWGYSNRVLLCVAFARSLNWLHGLLVGCETQMQVLENLQAFQGALLSEEQRLEIRAALPQAPEALLDPALWPQRKR